MADQNTTQLLKDVPLFSDLNDKELAQIAETMKRRQFSAGQEIAREGESGVGFFVIEDGNAKVTVHGEEKRRLGPGDYFGEIALIAQSARTASVTAESDLTAHGMTFQSRPYLIDTSAPCVLASERPSHPCDERRSANPS